MGITLQWYSFAEHLIQPLLHPGLADDLFHLDVSKAVA